jgi:hypothetical protein
MRALVLLETLHIAPSLIHQPNPERLQSDYDCDKAKHCVVWQGLIFMPYVRVVFFPCRAGASGLCC